MKKLIIPVFAVVLLAVAMQVQSSSPAATVCEPPEVHLAEIAGCQSTVVEPSEEELNILPKDTRLEKRRYVEADGNWSVVSVVVGGKHKGSIHRPELCLPAQGYLMANPHNTEVDGVAWHMLTLEGGAGRPSVGFAYTFFNQAGFHTASHTRRIFQDVWDRSVFNRIDRWVMVTVVSSHADDGSMRKFLGNLSAIVR